MSYSKTFMFFYICACTLYFAWGFTKLSGFYLIFVNPKLYIPQIFIAIGYFISVLALDNLVPNSLKKYHTVSFILSLGILSLFLIINLMIRRNNLGNLLFSSQPIIQNIYFAIILSLLWIWSLSRIQKAASGKTISSTIDIGGMKINSYLWFGCIFFMMLSASIYICIFLGWNKLEIREKGIWLINETVWEEIVDYSWEQDKNADILVIKQINGFNKEIENKYKINSNDKEIVNQILSDKLRE
ncbi:MAG: hypothetical protein AAF383_10650 [Cyanobacteria bacterium P01_A01_bin.83]